MCACAILLQSRLHFRKYHIDYFIFFRMVDIRQKRHLIFKIWFSVSEGTTRHPVHVTAVSAQICPFSIVVREMPAEIWTINKLLVHAEMVRKLATDTGARSSLSRVIQYKRTDDFTLIWKFIISSF